MNNVVNRIVVILLLLIATGSVVLWAQAEEHGRKSDAILAEIMENQNVDSVSRIDPDDVSSEALEELGDAVMGLMIGDAREHATMDRMMGGEGSEQLSSAHRWLGYSYLENDGNLNNVGWGPGMMGFGMMGGSGWNGGPWRQGMMGGNWGGSYWGRGGMMSMANPWVWIFVAVIIVLVVFIVVGFLRKRRNTGSHTALEVLRTRYAKGEISAEEYKRIKDELK